MQGQTASAAARVALLVFREPKPKKSKATSNDQANPAHPLRHRPISDDDWPVLKNPHQVEQRHQGDGPWAMISSPYSQLFARQGYFDCSHACCPHTN
jgi:hypothetical protein